MSETEDPPQGGKPEKSGKKKRKGPGRPSALEDPEMNKRLLNVVKLLRVGAHRQPACHTAKVPWSTFRDVLRRGKSKAGKHAAERDFRQAVMEAESEAEIRVGTAAYKEALKNPKVMLTYLAVRWRKRWNPREQVELTGKNGGPMELKSETTELPPDLSSLSVEELRLYKALQEKMVEATRKKREAKRKKTED